MTENSTYELVHVEFHNNATLDITCNPGYVFPFLPRSASSVYHSKLCINDTLDSTFVDCVGWSPRNQQIVNLSYLILYINGARL